MTASLRRLLVIFFLSAAIPLSSHAQTARVAGFIQDSSHAAVSHATIHIEEKTTHVKWEVQSNGEGLYSLPSLQPGIYLLTVSAPGFETQTVDNLKVEVAGKISLDLILNVGSQSQTITVDAAAAQINTADASVSTVINRQFVANMPLNGRSLQSLLTLAPGTSQVPSSGAGYSGEITVNGQRTEANYYTVDGVNVNNGAIAPQGNVGFSGGVSGATPSATALGTTQNLVSIDALQEFRAITSTYSAEYGRTPGGQFVFNTRSGTNQWHGTAFDYLRNGAMDANSWFSNHTNVARQQEQQNDFGGVFSGPIFRDKTFFFFSYEGLRLKVPTGAQSYAVPSTSLRSSVPAALQSFVNAFPTPTPGTDLGNGIAFYVGGYSTPANVDTSSIRLDHSFGDRFKIFGRYSDSSSDSKSRFGYNPAQLNTTSVDNKSLTLGATNVLPKLFVNEFRFNLARNDSDYRPVIDNFAGATGFSQASGGLTPSSWLFTEIYDFATGYFPTISLTPQAIRQRPLNIVDYVTKSVGRHTLKFGVDYRRIYSSQRMPEVYEYNIFFSAASAQANSAESAGAYNRSGYMRPVYTNLSFYGQDEWKVTPRLSLSLGLRWDINPAPKDRDGNGPYAITSADLQTTTVAPESTPLWKTSYRNLAPRLGFAYKASDKPGHETVIRGGIGLFYDTGNTLSSQGYSGIGRVGFQSFNGSAFPLTPAQLAGIPSPSTSSPYTAVVYGFNPDLKAPYTVQWNLAVDQALGRADSLLINYVGSTGNDLLVQKAYQPENLGNANFANGQSLYFTNNMASSSYHALQTQLTHRLGGGLQALFSYTWSKSIDSASTNFQVFTSQRGPSNFDIRHNFQAALTYEVPRHFTAPLASEVLDHWALDTRVSARSALPVDLVGTTTIDGATGANTNYHPNYDRSKPLYVSNSNAPGGRLINYEAFSTAYAPDGTTPAEGNSGRNSVRGFNAVQADVAFRREFYFTERVGLQFRAEAFNVLNHPVFGDITNNVSSGPANTSLLTGFGIATNLLASQLGGLNSLYQTGGPRSLQLALKLHF